MVPSNLEAISKPQIAFEGKAGADDKARHLKNETFFCQARKAKILTGGIRYVFRGLKLEA